MFAWFNQKVDCGHMACSRGTESLWTRRSGSADRECSNSMATVALPVSVHLSGFHRLYGSSSRHRESARMATAGKLQFAADQVEPSGLLAVLAYDAVKLGDEARLLSGLHAVALADFGGVMRHAHHRHVAPTEFRLGCMGASSRSRARGSPSRSASSRSRLCSFVARSHEEQFIWADGHSQCVG